MSDGDLYAGNLYFFLPGEPTNMHENSGSI